MVVFDKLDSTFGDYYYTERMSYDKSGNITQLIRWDNSDEMNRLHYTYDGNQLVKVTDQGFEPVDYDCKRYMDMADVSQEMGYDANGNLVYDLDRQIVAIRYNLLNLPDTVQFANGNQIINHYDALGNRYKTSYRTRKVAATVPLGTTLPNTNNPSDYTLLTHVMDKNMKYVAYGNDALTLDCVFNTEGYIRYYGSVEHYLFYYIKDHLGNIRETYVYPWSNYKECVQRMQYYPSGLPWNETWNASEQPYKYNGKEFVEMHGLDEYDSEARWYYPALGRTTTMDPLAEKYYNISPYAWCGNNIINFIDPNGMNVWRVDSTGIVVDTTPTDETDRVEVETVNEESNTAEIISIDFEKGTIILVDNNKNKTVFQVKGENAGAGLFKFLADNVPNIEFVLANTQEGTSFISTNHLRKKVGFTSLLKRTNQNRLTINSVIHNHPENSGPFGFGESSDDENDRRTAVNNPDIYEWYVYQSKNNQLVFYTAQMIWEAENWSNKYPQQTGVISIQTRNLTFWEKLKRFFK